MDQHLCHCRRCGRGGQFVSRTTYQRHSNWTDAILPPLPSPSSPPVSADAGNSGHNNSPSLDPSPDPTASSQMLQINSINYIRHLLSQKRANFDFPPSLVFAVPPTEDSNRYHPSADDRLLLPNSYHPLSLSDNNSVSVVTYEYLLVEHLNVLNALPLQDGCTSASEVETTRNEILGTLRYLDQRKGDAWNKQLRVRLNPNTFIISGEDHMPISRR